MEARGLATVRRFSRVVTQRLGALNDEYLARPRPLGASRVLYEIGEAGANARAIRSRPASIPDISAGCCAGSRMNPWSPSAVTPTMAACGSSG
jgi:hypothetical protein